MRGIRVWARLLGLRRAVVEDVRLGSEGEVIVSVRPVWRERDRCGVCRRRSPGYDLGQGRRRWRALDLGTTHAFVEAESPRVTCRRHGVVVVAVPWARHDSRFTRAFEDQVAWLAVNTSKTAVAELMRVAWRSVGTILERVAAEAVREVDLLDGLRRIGIDEISHRKGQRYLTVVVDHHTGRLVWAAPGRDRKTVLAFFDALGEERCQQIELVSADMAAWISGPIADRVPDAVRCVDPFHVVMLATEALDDVRREVWNEARRQGNLELARELKGRPVRGLEEPGEPHRPPGLQARDDPADQCAALPRVPTQGAAAPDLPTPRRRGESPARRLAEVGASITSAGIRQARPHDHRATRRDPGRDPARPLQRPHRASQHPDPTDRAEGLRVPLTTPADRTRDAQTRRSLPTATTVTRPTESPMSSKG
jgi:Transposase/Helix-turn-helix domain of transposase family ISL3/zinc-finger of transposase IS204/IS1001/IS1096/IS1165